MSGRALDEATQQVRTLADTSQPDRTFAIYFGVAWVLSVVFVLSLARAASRCPETEDLIAAQDGRIQYLSKELYGGGSSC
jgi:hypothetical protein